MKSTSSISPYGDQWSALAFARIVLVGIVLASHANLFFTAPAWIGWLGDFGGITAVLGLFVVGGYRIAHSIECQPRGFYRRRLERTYPVYLAVFFVALIPYAIWGWNFRFRIPVGPQAWVDYPNSGPWDCIGTLFFLNGFFVNTPGSLATAWSLSLEVCFYALAPLLVRVPSAILALLIAGSILWRLNPPLYFGEGYTYAIKHIGFLSHGGGIPVTAWAWLLGFLSYRYRRRPVAKKMLILLGLFPVAFWGGAGIQNAVTYAFVASVLIAFDGYTKFAFNGAPLYINLPKLPAKLLPVATYLGDLSYPLYLIQAPVLVILAANDHKLSCWYFLVSSIAASALVLHLVDYPAQRFFRRLQSE